MKKILAIFTLTAVIAAALTGCHKEELPRLEKVTEPVDLGPVYYNGSAEAETFLTGLDGKKIKASEIKYLKNKNNAPTTVLDESDFGHAECDGFTYGFVPGVYFDAESSPEKFGSDKLSYIGEKAGESKEFIRINVGDKFGSLTVKSAKCYFASYILNGEDYLGYSDGELEFDGEITLTGLLEIPEQISAYPGMVLEMNFFGGTENGIPLSIACWYEPETGYRHIPLDYHRAYTDVPLLYLGKFPDYSIDFDGLAEGDEAKVEITVTGLKLFSDLGECHATAEIVEVKRL